MILMIIKIIIVFKDSKEKLRLWLTLKIAKVTDIEKYNLYLYTDLTQLGECFPYKEEVTDSNHVIGTKIKSKKGQVQSPE